MTDNNKEEKEKVQSILSELEKIKEKWCQIIEELENKKNEYQNLIYTIVEVKDTMFDMNIHIPWYQKLRMKIRKRFK